MPPDPAPDLSPLTFDQARAQFPVLEKIAYLNAGTFGPLARATFDAIRRELERDFGEGRSGMPYLLRVLELRGKARARVAGLVAADPEQVALTASTTDSCNIVVAGLGLGAGDEIVTTTDEHFGLLGPLGASGARVIVVDPEPDAILAAVSPRTRLLALSQVLWTTGRILPVRELREAAGVAILVDGAQSVGAIPVDAAGLDFLTISGQKWLCGPDSTGALVVADPERLRVAAPSYFAQAGYEPDGSFEPRPGAVRFEPNWLSAASLAGLLAAMDVRPGWAFDHAAAVAERCRTMVSAHVEVVTPEHRSTLVAFRSPGNSAELVETLYAAGVHVREIPRSGLIRVSCGWWTSDADLDRLVAELPA
jgi:L-cysteine/cystine lyase